MLKIVELETVFHGENWLRKVKNGYKVLPLVSSQNAKICLTEFICYDLAVMI